jgi:hypothetical protein
VAAWLAMLWAGSLSVGEVYAASETTMSNIAAIGSFLSPIILLVVGWFITRSNKRQEREAEERRDQRKIEAEERELVRIEAAKDREFTRGVALRAEAAAHEAKIAALKVERRADLAAEKVEEVKTALQETNAETKGALAEIKETQKDQNVVIASSHDLGNSAMEASLTITARIAREKANENPGSKSDRVAAELAETALAEHKKKQLRTDAAAGGADNVKDAVAALMPSGTTDADVLAAKERMSRPKGDTTP